MNAVSDFSTPPATQVVTIKDNVSLTLNEADLTGKKPADRLLTPQRTIPWSDGLQWWIHYYPVGWREAAKDHVGVFLSVNKPVNTKVTIAVDGFPISDTYTGCINPLAGCIGWTRLLYHEQLRPIFRDGKLTITCSVGFDILAPVIHVPRVFQLFEHVPMDVEFAIGSERVPAHKNFLGLISPVLQAMFTHDTAEAKSGIIGITEFDFDTVKAAVDFCYSRELRELSVEIVVNILRFCDKYFIAPVIKELEKLPLLNPSVENFCIIVQYAYDCNKDSLLADCHNYFKDHHDEIKATEEFVKLPPALVVDMLKAVFELKTKYDILRHAHKNTIYFVVEHLEKPFFNSLSLDNFCDAVSYAWDCSREELQQVCAKYLNEHRDKVLDLDGFHDSRRDFGDSSRKRARSLASLHATRRKSVEKRRGSVHFLTFWKKSSLHSIRYFGTDATKSHAVCVKLTAIS